MKPTNKILWARQCDVTEEGMNEGWCWGDGHFYTKRYETSYHSRTDVKDHPDRKIPCRRGVISVGSTRWTKGPILWTEWECEDDIQWEEVNGELIEFEQ